MDIGSEPNVVGQIPAVMVGIIVDYDIVGSPVPIVAIIEIIWGDRKIETAEPESARASSLDPKGMSPANAAAKSSMLEWMVEVIVSIVFPRVMTDPFVSLGMDMGSVWVPLRVTIRTSSLWSLPGLLLRLARLLLRLPGLLLRLAGLLLCRSGPRSWRRPGMRSWTVSGDMSPANAPHRSTSLPPSLLFSTAFLRRRGDCDQQECEQ